MKKYLVLYDVSRSVTDHTKTTIVEMEDNYCPAEDDMKALREKVTEQDKPRYTKTSAAPSACGGYLTLSEWEEIPADKLRVLAVSNLNV